MTRYNVPLQRLKLFLKTTFCPQKFDLFTFFDYISINRPNGSMDRVIYCFLHKWRYHGTTE